MDRSVASHFTLVVVVLLGVFLYAGWRLSHVQKADAPLAPITEQPGATLVTTAPRPAMGTTPLSPVPVVAAPVEETAPALGGRRDEALPDPAREDPLVARLSAPDRPSSVLPRDDLDGGEAGLSPHLTPSVAGSLEERLDSTGRDIVPAAVEATDYTVKRGDTLSGIAFQFCGNGGRWREIVRENNLSGPSALRVGMRLRIPASMRRSTAPFTPAPVATSSRESVHTVASGESLISIAARYYGKTDFRYVQVLRKANPALVRNGGVLRIGMRLTIPDLDDGASAARTPAPAAATVSSEAAPRVYTVRPGDSLSTISRSVYGTSRAWRKIYQANRARIAHPDRLQAGVTLQIPPLQD